MLSITQDEVRKGEGRREAAELHLVALLARVLSILFSLSPHSSQARAAAIADIIAELTARLAAGEDVDLNLIKYQVKDEKGESLFRSPRLSLPPSHPPTSLSLSVHIS